MLCLTDKKMQEAAALESAYMMSYPWNDTHREDVPRYFKKDGWWENPAAPKNGKALLSCTGDLICEPRLIRANRFGDTVFFHPLFQYVRPILKQSDLVLGNLETTVSDMTPDAGKFHTVAGKYHCNTTESFLDALRYAGFDGVANANNHNCDSGALGLIETNQRLDKHGFFRTGTFLPGETNRAALVNVNGIRLGILSYTNRYNRNETNFTPLGQAMLNTISEEKVLADVAWAKQRGAEFILCYIHWGREYVQYPIEEETQEAQLLADCGVDYIVGSHSHCLQINDRITARDGRTVPVIYSMGNFITNDAHEISHHSGVLQILLSKTEAGIQITDWFVPGYIFEHFDGMRYGIVPADTLHNGGFNHPRLPQTQAFYKTLIDLPEPASGAITAKELCKLFGIPELDSDFAISGICTCAEQILDRQLYFSLGNESGYETLCLRRRRPILVVAAQPHPDHLTLVVPDVKTAYRQLVKHLRSRFAAKFITVAGAENKTATAELIAKTLSLTHRVHTGKTDHAWLYLHPSHDLCVQELRSSPLGYPRLDPAICVITSCTEDLSDLLESLSENTLVLYNAEDAQLAEALQGKPFTPIPCPGMRLDTAFGAAAAVANALDLPAPPVLAYSGMEQNIFKVKGTTVLTDYACKSEKSAKASLAVLANSPGKRIAVIEDTYAPLARADAVIAVAQPSEERTERTAAEHALEKQILAQLEDGCTVLFCGGRHLALNLTLRRIFGLTDGEIYDLT